MLPVVLGQAAEWGDTVDLPLTVTKSCNLCKPVSVLINYGQDSGRKSTRTTMGLSIHTHASLRCGAVWLCDRGGEGGCLDPNHCFSSACKVFFSFCKILKESKGHISWNNQMIKGTGVPKSVLMLISSHKVTWGPDVGTKMHGTGSPSEMPQELLAFLMGPWAASCICDIWTLIKHAINFFHRKAIWSTTYFLVNGVIIIEPNLIWWQILIISYYVYWQIKWRVNFFKRPFPMLTLFFN